MSDFYSFDVLIIGSGAAGMSCALSLSQKLSIAIISKEVLLEGSSFYAQGGVSAVLSSVDSFEAHIQDTLQTAKGLANEEAVSFMVKNAPKAIAKLESYGVKFTQKDSQYHLTTEGGHSSRRVAHVSDKTGSAIQGNLLSVVKSQKNITFFEHHLALDLLTKDKQCYGCFILDKYSNQVKRFFAKQTVLATGGASKAYFYTSNPNTSTGDGMAMAYRTGCHLVDMEFNQFHPTCLYHPKARSFLISEALRGEGAKLSLPNGESFMHKYDPRAELAPRDIVAYAIDKEMKRLGVDCVYLDISFKQTDWIKSHFPTIYQKCLSFGVDITTSRIPIVPSAHYTCGGVEVDLSAKTNCSGLYAIGEVAWSGVHGANRMASNSLLECLVFADACAQDINQQTTLILPKISDLKNQFKSWDFSRVSIADEKIIIKHLWDEVRRLMWDFVGIVRNTERLQYAQSHLNTIKQTVDGYYRQHMVCADLIELRNLVQVACVVVESSLARKESRGLYYNSDYPKQAKQAKHTIVFCKISR